MNFFQSAKWKKKGGGEIGWNEAAKQWTDSDEAAKRPQAAVALTIDWQ